MAKGEYAVVDNTTKKIKKKYAVIDGITRKIKKEYAVVDGVTKLIWSADNKCYYAWNYSDNYIYCSDEPSVWTKTGMSMSKPISMAGFGNHAIVLSSISTYYTYTKDRFNTYTNVSLSSIFGTDQRYIPNQIAYGNGIYVMLYYAETSDYYALCWSTDMVNWTRCTTRISTPIGYVQQTFALGRYNYSTGLGHTHSICFTNGYFTLESSYLHYYSSNGKEFESGNGTVDGNVIVEYNKGKYYAIHTNRRSTISNFTMHMYYRTSPSSAYTYTSAKILNSDDLMSSITTFKNELYIGSTYSVFRMKDENTSISVYGRSYQTTVVALLPTEDRLYAVLNPSSYSGYNPTIIYTTTGEINDWTVADINVYYSSTANPFRYGITVET